MKIEVNGDQQTVSAETVAAALAELGYPEAGVATALNGEFVAAAQRASRSLSDGDRLEILSPMQGG